MSKTSTNERSIHVYLTSGMAESLKIGGGESIIVMWGQICPHMTVPPALNFKKPSPARDPLLLSQTVSIFKEMASKKVMSPIASAKLEFRTKTSDPKHQLFGKKILVIYTPYGEIYRVSIKARTTTSYWTVQ